MLFNCKKVLVLAPHTDDGEFGCSLRFLPDGEPYESSPAITQRDFLELQKKLKSL